MEEIEEHLRSLIGKFKRQISPPMLLDAAGRSFEDPYYTQCLSCGRMVLVGECCDEYVTLNMIDKGE